MLVIRNGRAMEKDSFQRVSDKHIYYVIRNNL